MSRGPHGLPKSVRFDQSAEQNGPPAAMPNDSSRYLPSKILSHQIITSDPLGFQQQPLSLMAHDNHRFGTYFTDPPNISGAASMPNPAPPPTFYNLPPHTEIPDNSFLTPYVEQQDVHGQALGVVGNLPTRQTRVLIACDKCRNSKRKCNGRRPCHNCSSEGECEYKEKPVKKDEIRHRMETEYRTLSDGIASLPERFDRIERLIQASQASFEPLNIAATALSGPEPFLSSYASTTIGPRHTRISNVFGIETTLDTKHTNSAHATLEWPVLKPFFQGVVPGGIHYPQKLEDERGTLKLYGKEDVDICDAYESTEDDFISTSAPSPSPNRPCVSSTAPPVEADANRSNKKLWSGRNPDKTLKLDVQTVQRLHRRYLSLMHPLQPFLNKERLASMFYEFMVQYSPDVGKCIYEPVVGMFILRPKSVSKPQPQMPPSRSTDIERTIRNAIVLLVLALGMVCEHKTHLPSPTSLDNTTPGLAYYTCASEILGVSYAGTTLPYGQAGILACLYMGQLARVQESWNWICYACRICGGLIDTNKELLDYGTSRADPIRLLYWTCWQLESDIFAEMSHFRPSSISEDEERIGLPSSVHLDLPDKIDGMYYSAQIGLQRILNKIQAALYYKRRDRSDIRDEAREDCLERELQAWREELSDWLQWDDSDPPSDKINAARMRAKYYGARYVITKPILYRAIHTNPAPEILIQQYSSASADENNSSDPSEKLSPASQRHWNRILSASKHCVDSAVQSTIAFDSIENADRRLIVTNIFGTAHAQFGNCLVLTAVRKSWMRDLIPHNRVIRLIKRTVKFLRRLEPISPTLREDAVILENMLNSLHGRQPEVS